MCSMKLDIEKDCLPLNLERSSKTTTESYHCMIEYKNTLGHKVVRFHSVISEWRPAVNSLPLHHTSDSTEVSLQPGMT